MAAPREKRSVVENHPGVPTTCLAAVLGCSPSQVRRLRPGVHAPGLSKMRTGQHIMRLRPDLTPSQVARMVGMHGSALKSRGLMRSCRECGQEFRAVQANTACCSRRCNRRLTSRDLNHRRRMATRTGGVPIGVHELAERDGYTCHLCNGLVVLLPMRPNHPLSATVDHILPISKGGTHTWDNVALAHFGCNAAKGNRVA